MPKSSQRLRANACDFREVIMFMQNYELKVRINEVATRDGFQSESQSLFQR